MCTQSCIVAASVGDASPRLIAKAGQPCRVPAVVWIWRVGRCPEGRETGHYNGLCERWCWWPSSSGSRSLPGGLVGTAQLLEIRNAFSQGVNIVLALPLSLLEAWLGWSLCSLITRLILRIGTSSCLVRNFIWGNWTWQVLKEYSLKEQIKQINWKTHCKFNSHNVFIPIIMFIWCKVANSDSVHLKHFYNANKEMLQNN